MSEPMVTLEAIHERLNKLEKQNQRLKRIMASGVLMLCVVVLMGEAGTTPRLIEAHAFVLTDYSGRARAKLTSLPDGRVALSLDDSNGRARFVMGLDARGSPMLALADPKGRARIAMGMTAGSSPQVALADSEGKTEAVFALDSDGLPGLALRSPSGEGEAFINVDASGEPLLKLRSRDGEELDMGGVPTGAPTISRTPLASAASIVLLGKHGRVIWKAP